MSAQQTAWLLNCTLLDIRILIAAGLLIPLGNPPANAQKFFCREEILTLGRDSEWLAAASDAVHHYWFLKNGMKKFNCSPSDERSA